MSLKISSEAEVSGNFHQTNSKSQMARTLKHKERLVPRPIEDLMFTVKDGDFTTMRGGEEFQDRRREVVTGFKKRIAPVAAVEGTRHNMIPNGNLIFEDFAKRGNQLLGNQTMEESLEIDETSYISSIKEEPPELMDDNDYAAAVRSERSRADEPCADEPCVVKSRAVDCSVAMVPSDAIQDEFKTVDEIKEEEERLLLELERRLESASQLRKAVNERLARIEIMREFLRVASPINDPEEMETEEETELMKKRVNETMEDCCVTAEQSVSFSDKFTIVDENGKCDASMVVTLTDKRPKEGRLKKTYRITYDITDSQINRSSYVFMDDNTVPLQTSNIRKTAVASTSKMTTRSMTSAEGNLTAKPKEAVKRRRVRGRRITRRRVAWDTSTRSRKQVIQLQNRKGRDPLTLKRNEKGRFIKKNL